MWADDKCKCLIHVMCPDHGMAGKMNKMIEIAEEIDAKTDKESKE